jgi:hypothetical protein
MKLGDDFGNEQDFYNVMAKKHGWDPEGHGDDWYDMTRDLLSPAEQRGFRNNVDDFWDGSHWLAENRPDLVEPQWYGRESWPTDEEKVIQIKGGGNKKPKDEYIPYVQDFVKSGKWSEVGDLRNSGLMTFKPELNKDLIEAMKARGVEPPTYVTESELNDILKTYDKFAKGGMVKGYAMGGLVQQTDPMNDDLMQNLLQIAAEKYHQFAPPRV